MCSQILRPQHARPGSSCSPAARPRHLNLSLQIRGPMQLSCAFREGRWDRCQTTRESSSRESRRSSHGRSSHRSASPCSPSSSDTCPAGSTWQHSAALGRTADRQTEEEKETFPVPKSWAGSVQPEELSALGAALVLQRGHQSKRKCDARSCQRVLGCQLSLSRVSVSSATALGCCLSSQQAGPSPCKLTRTKREDAKKEQTPEHRADACSLVGSVDDDGITFWRERESGRHGAVAGRSSLGKSCDDLL